MKKLVSVFALVSLVVWWFGSDSTIATTAEVEQAEAITDLATAVFLLPIAGVVQSVDELVVTAKTNGTIQGDNTSVGEFVVAGQFLTEIRNPVLTAKYNSQLLASALSVLQSDVMTAEVELGEATANSLVYEKQAKDNLAYLVDDNRQEEVVQSLVLWINKARIELPTIIQFIDQNPTLLPAGSRQRLQAITNSLYGFVPSYLNISRVLYSHNQQLGLFERLTASPNNEDVIEIISELEILLREIRGLLVDAERNFLGDLEETDNRKNQYGKNLSSIEKLVADLHQIKISHQTLLDIQNNSGIERVESLKRLDAEAITRSYIKQINEVVAKTTNDLSEAEVNLVATEIALGIVQAPFSGVITERYVTTGSYVQPGQALFKLVGNEARELIVTVPAEVSNFLRVGDEFIISGAVMGTVSKVSLVQRGQGVTVIVSLSSRLPVGASVVGEFQIALDRDKTLRNIDRSELLFSIIGPTVLDNSGHRVPIKIISDRGDRLLVKIIEKPTANIDQG